MTIIDKRGKIISLWEKAREGRNVYIFIKMGLIFCSWIFGLCVILRRLIYRYGIKRSVSLNARVISVGNITLGGTGKTPLVEYIARKALHKNKKAVILSRGYKGGDEAGLLLKKVKGIVLTGKNRSALGKEAVERFGAEIIILDDGFQHWALRRNMDIVTIDSTSPPWKESLFPAGILRERVNSLKRAHVFVITRADSNGDNVEICRRYLKTINPGASVFITVHKPLCFITRSGENFPPCLVKGRDIITFSGIGRPDIFEETLKRLGARPVCSLRYPDHYNYTLRDLEEIKEIGRDRIIVTTEKDLVRINADILDSHLLALVVEISFLKDEDRFIAIIGLNE